MSNIEAIVGRPNVGKSTLFNRLIQARKAIIHESSGVTRDRHYGKSDWNGKEFSIVDTGGYVRNSDDIFEAEIRKQVLIAIEEAQVILFVVEVLSGITDLDEQVADILRKSNKKILVVVNKIDNNQRRYEAAEFYGLGLGEINMLSAVNGSGTGDLLDKVVELLPKDEETEDEEDSPPKFAIVGRPNAGKSSLVNALIGVERNIVTPISGTTRDSIYTRYNKFGYDFVLVDTAGLRKKSKVSEDIEYYSNLRAIRTIEDSDVCLLMLDATRGIEGQDLNIFNLIIRNKKGVVILVNKWDLIDKEKITVKQFQEDLEKRLAPFTDVPILFISALTKQRVLKALEAGIQVFKSKKQRITTSKLNELMQAAIDNYGPPAVKGKFIQIKYVTQLPTFTPTFAFFCNLPQYIKDPYKRYLENYLRREFNFTGVPIQLFFRKK